MKITIENYTEHCLKTWGGENQKERAELGIIGELGEVAEVLKKYLRGDFDEVERDKRLLKELGDVLYYIAIDIHLLDMTYDFVEELQSYDKHEIHEMCHWYREDSTTELIIKCTSNIFTPSWDTLSNFIVLLTRFKFSIEQVMQANIEKLAKRAENGLIQGDGDNRGE